MDTYDIILLIGSLIFLTITLVKLLKSKKNETITLKKIPYYFKELFLWAMIIIISVK